MPQRSNDFQRLVALIEGQLASDETAVTESKLVLDTAGIEREIDISIEGALGGHAVSIAVETRDRSRPADVTWIDDLVGKYRHLPIDKVVAVSRLGFTSNALSGAAASTAPRIETLTLEEALETDWKAVFSELREMVTDFLSPVGKSARLTIIAARGTPPDLVEGFALETAVTEDAAGNPRQPLAALADEVIQDEAVLAKIHDTVAPNTVATIGLQVDVPRQTFLSDGHNRIELAAIRIEATFRRDLQAVPVHHGAYSGAHIATATAATGSGSAQFALVQSQPGEFGISASFEHEGFVELRLKGQHLDNLRISMKKTDEEPKTD